MSKRAKITLWIWGVLNTLLAGLCAYSSIFFSLMWQRGEQDPNYALDHCLIPSLVLALVEVSTAGLVCATMSIIGCFLLYRQKVTGYLMAWFGLIAGTLYGNFVFGSSANMFMLLDALYAFALLLLFWLADVGKILRSSIKNSDESSIQ